MQAERSEIAKLVQDNAALTEQNTASCSSKHSGAAESRIARIQPATAEAVRWAGAECAKEVEMGHSR